MYKEVDSCLCVSVLACISELEIGTVLDSNDTNILTGSERPHTCNMYYGNHTLESNICT